MTTIQSIEQEFEKQFKTAINAENCYVGDVNNIKQFYSQKIKEMITEMKKKYEKD